jgi:hypothetical protein
MCDGNYIDWLRLLDPRSARQIEGCSGLTRTPSQCDLDEIAVLKARQTQLEVAANSPPI